MKKDLFLAAIAILLGLATAHAQEADAVSLDKIVVTPYRYSEDVGMAATGITRIGPEDIAKSGANKLIDVLSSATGLLVRDWYGNATKAAVDIRGFGEQAALNNLVMIDGRRVNEVDLSGVNWTQIPLEQVESIEIIRGGSGGVLYGDNATSGVINIITKKGKGKPHAELQSKYGSYDTNAQNLSVSGSTDKLSYWVQSGHEMTNGYRKNSYYKSTDTASKINYSPTDKLNFRFSAADHNSSYGLPASVYQYMIDGHGRSYAKNGDDHANDRDYYFMLTGENEFGDWGKAGVDFSFKRKDVDSYFLTSGLNTQKSQIDTYGITPKYVLDKNLLGRNNKFITGFDYYRSYYSMRASDRTTGANQNYTNTNKISLAGYFQDEFFILEKLAAVGGYRYEAVRYEFNYHDFTGFNPEIDTKILPNKKAFNSGLVYNYKNESSLFANINQNFRFPAVDEFTYNDAMWQQQLNTQLKPQTSLNYEAGVRHQFNANLRAELSYYLMNVKNELYYNYTGGPTGTGKNENYDKTRHQGMEFAFNSKINKMLGFYGNYAYTKATFIDGMYSNNDIPMVPRNKGTIGARLSFLDERLSFSINGNYVGKRYFLNDQSNSVSKLNSYMVADLSVSYKLKGLTATFGINNLFDKQYCEYAGYNAFVSDKFYYPSPTRNLSLKLDYKF